jgi:N-acetyl sugar amidotransferase
MAESYQVCEKCVMDTSDPDIKFNSEGICNHCIEYDHLHKNYFPVSSEDKAKKLELTVRKIKEHGKGREYDCIIGLSGGIDSTYVAYMVKKLGLRPLAVHLDNGWNSELAVKNIENIVKKLDMDLYTYVIDWEEFRDMQVSYLKASVIDTEVLTDHAVRAILYRLANKHGLKYILNGKNYVSEAILPISWISDKNDLKNIISIQKRFGNKKIKTFPQLGLLRLNYFKHIKGINYIPFLNYIDYVKSDAQKILQNELEWRDYGGKHRESIFTKFFQAYILPVKFNIDKRKAHLSTLICSEQITREEALAELAKPLYQPLELQDEKDYIIKKLQLTHEQFEEIMQRKPKAFTDYPSYHNRLWYKILREIYHLYKKKIKLSLSQKQDAIFFQS